MTTTPTQSSNNEHVNQNATNFTSDSEMLGDSAISQHKGEDNQ